VDETYVKREDLLCDST